MDATRQVFVSARLREFAATCGYLLRLDATSRLNIDATTRASLSVIGDDAMDFATAQQSFFQQIASKWARSLDRVGMILATHFEATN